MKVPQISEVRRVAGNHDRHRKKQKLIGTLIGCHGWHSLCKSIHKRCLFFGDAAQRAAYLVYEGRYVRAQDDHQNTFEKHQQIADELAKEHRQMQEEGNTTNTRAPIE
jgi:hypothetical protein